MEAAGDMKGAVIAGNLQNELCKRTMDIFVTVSISSFLLVMMLMLLSHHCIVVRES